MNVATCRTLSAAFIVCTFSATSLTALAQTDPNLSTSDAALYDAPPPDPAAQDASATTEAEATEEADTDGRPERVKVHDIGLGYHAVLFRTESTDRYALHGPSVVYNYFVGRRWGFVLRGAAHFPLTGRMNGPSGEFRGSLRQTYAARHYGFDTIFGFGRRMQVNDRLTMTVSTGVHLQSFTMSGDNVSPVEAITMGLAGTARLEYRLKGILHFGAEFLLALDPIDLIKHQNRAVLTIPMAGVLSLGLDI